ncbi:MAG: hypothetical protein IPK01_11360 [Acidobacteria bacterium]|nr:hypothetical protein [Acidobacteriota bacterium]
MPNEGTGFLPRILTIAKNAFREAVRDRILYNLIIFVLLITASAIFLGELTAGQESRVIVNLGLSSVLLFGAFHRDICRGQFGVERDRKADRIFDLFRSPLVAGNSSSANISGFVSHCL